MIEQIKNTLLTLLDQYHELGISGQIDYDKFYLYSLITHSTEDLPSRKWKHSCFLKKVLHLLKER